jgi:hypothetical protein
MAKSVISAQTGEEIIEYYNAGFRVCEISNMTGIKQSTVRMFLNRKGEKLQRQKDAEGIVKEMFTAPTPNPKALPAEAMQTQPVKEKTLKDFQSRDMIKYLYDLGYRIENNQLVCLVKQVVNVKDIIHS